MIHRLDTLFDELLARPEVKHAAAAVVRGDGALRWERAGGSASPDGAPMTPATPFFIASIDKLYTATLILLLHEEGVVELDAPMSAYLPNRVVGGLHRMGGVDRTGEITLRHLLGHTSGLPDWLDDRPRGGPSLVEELVEGGDREMELEDITARVRERLTPHFPPQPLEARRQRIIYSDTNFILLAAVVEAVSERPLHQVWEERLLRPLGLRHTWMAGRSHPLEPAPEPAALWAGDDPLEIPRLIRSFHGVYSTLADTLAFLQALMGGRVFREEGTGRLMRERWRRFGVSFEFPPRRPGWPIEYGLGMMRFHLPRLLTPLRPPPEVMGHTGSTGTWLFHCPALDLYLSGTVDQVAAAAVPFRFVPRVLRALGG